MRRRRLIYHLFPSYLLITLGALAALLWYGSGWLEDFQRSQTQAALEARASLAEPQVAGPLSADDGPAVNALCHEFKQRAGARFTAIRPDGKVLGDSDEDPAMMENHADRPEVIQAHGQRERRLRALQLHPEPAHDVRGRARAGQRTDRRRVARRPCR